ncbi:MAG: PIN domain-containing protein, partial [Patescibacteria group bacterium]|nr:PIN domain-containing protein [Patescibacteria group bacterium]
RSFLELIKGNQIKAYTCGLVLAEVLWVLSSYYHVKKPGLIEALKSILNLRGLRVIDKIDYLKAEKIYEKFNVKFIDAVIASVAIVDSTRWLIVSYDKDFDRIGVIRKEPGQI